MQKPLSQHFSLENAAFTFIETSQELSPKGNHLRHSHNSNQLASKIENGDDALHFYDCVKIHVQYIKLQTHHSSKNVVADSCAMF